MIEDIWPALEALQKAELPTALRQSNLAYPAVNAAHIGGLALLFGSIVPLDLRLLGFWRSVPVADLARVLLPTAIAGLILAIVTGALLFSVHAVKYAAMPVFQLKLLLIAAAGVNALALRGAVSWSNALGKRSGPGILAGRIRLAGLISIALWMGVIFCGRMIAYYA